METTQRTYTDKQVRALKAGDELVGCKIIRGPYDSIKCPRGKYNLVVEYLDGTQKVVQWGRNTTVGVKIQ